ncbi:MAG: hypothetical protein IJX38_02180 [Clostridia bacterium]|nr:hypothetical protein [Clostridia bacterium]MBQ8371736.1 hypothetical protein [Clostridia bacterium]
MELARQSVKKRLVISLICVALALLGTVGLALTALKSLFVIMGILIPVTAFGYYGMVFFFAAYGRARAIARCVAAVNAGMLTLDEISVSARLKTGIVYRYLAVAISRRYLTDVALDNDGIVHI